MSSVLTDEKKEEWRKLPPPSPEQQRQLRAALDQRKLPPPSPEQQRQLRAALNRQAERIALAHAICGKYAFVQTSSEEFAASKAEEIALEDRPR